MAVKFFKSKFRRNIQWWIYLIIIRKAHLINRPQSWIGMGKMDEFDPHTYTITITKV